MSKDAVCYLNGEFLPLEAARISPLDRGFLFADGVYEVLPVYAGRPFRLDAHLARLNRSLQAIRLPSPLDDEAWGRLVGALIQQNGGGELSLYLQVTRGVGSRRDHAFPQPTQPTVFAYALPWPALPPELLSAGAHVITVPDLRWQRCDIKAIGLLANVLARQQAAEAGAQEALLVRDGLISEGAASNLFLVRDGRILTPPLGPQLLPGITRGLVLELARAQALSCEEAPVSTQMLADADEVWLASSIRELIPVTAVDGRPVGDGRPGPLWAQLRQSFDDYKSAFRRGEVS